MGSGYVDRRQHRLLQPIGNFPPAEAEVLFYAILDDVPMAAQLKPTGLPQTRDDSISVGSFPPSFECGLTVL